MDDGDANQVAEQGADGNADQDADQVAGAGEAYDEVADFADALEVSDALIAEVEADEFGALLGGEEDASSHEDGEDGESSQDDDDGEPMSVQGEQREDDGENGDEERGEESDSETDAEREAQMEHMRQVLRARGYRPRSAPPPPPVLSSFDLRGVAEYIVKNDCRDIVVMCGAGISVSAGIPDFRTPGTGLYDNLQKYDLPSPQSIFELSYFRERPDAFYRLCAELWPDNYAPTPTHHFITELHARGRLRRCFTQNIDSLEAAAHLPKEMIVAAHGNFDGASCVETGAAVPVEEVRAAVAHGKDGPGGWLAMAERHGGLVKPDIVFFGEPLPERFFRLAEADLHECDLLVILGTSLKVQPFASLVGIAPDHVPRLLINREEVGTDEQPLVKYLGFIDDKALHLDPERQYRDAFYGGDCDNGVRELARLLDEVAAAGGEAAAAAAEDDEAKTTWVAALEHRIASQAPPPRRPPSPPPVAAAAAASGSASTDDPPKEEQVAVEGEEGRGRDESEEAKAHEEVRQPADDVGAAPTSSTCNGGGADDAGVAQRGAAAEALGASSSGEAAEVASSSHASAVDDGEAACASPDRKAPRLE